MSRHKLDMTVVNREDSRFLVDTGYGKLAEVDRDTVNYIWRLRQVIKDAGLSENPRHNSSKMSLAPPTPESALYVKQMISPGVCIHGNEPGECTSAICKIHFSSQPSAAVANTDAQSLTPPPNNGDVALPNGCHLYWRMTEQGREYFSDEIGGGVYVWHTGLVDRDTMLAVVVQEATFTRLEYEIEERKRKR